MEKQRGMPRDAVRRIVEFFCLLKVGAAGERRRFSRGLRGH